MKSKISLLFLALLGFVAKSTAFKTCADPDGDVTTTNPFVCGNSSAFDEVVDVSCGGNACVARKRDATAVAWGDAAYGGDASGVNLTDVVDVSCGGSACVARKSGATAVVAWGFAATGGDASGVNFASICAIETGCTASYCCVISDCAAFTFGTGVVVGSTSPCSDGQILAAASTCNVDCGAGYVTQTNVAVTCASDAAAGAAAGGAPTCVANTCTCTGGTATVATGSAGTLCDVAGVDCSACADGYTISATAAAAGSQTCAADPCDSNIAAGGADDNVYTSSCSASDVASGSVCSLSCSKEGFFGTSTIDCTTGIFATTVAPICTAVNNAAAPAPAVNNDAAPAPAVNNDAAPALAVNNDAAPAPAVLSPMNICFIVLGIFVCFAVWYVCYHQKKKKEITAQKDLELQPNPTKK